MDSCAHESHVAAHVRRETRYGMRRCPGIRAAVVGERMSPGGEEFLLVLTKDIGDFKPMLHYRWRLSCSLATGESGSASNGLRTAWIICAETCR